MYVEVTRFYTLFCLFVFETGSCTVALVLMWLGSSDWSSSSVSQPSSGIIGIPYHVQHIDLETF